MKSGERDVHIPLAVVFAPVVTAGSRPGNWDRKAREPVESETVFDALMAFFCATDDGR
jgi:hypothetical protein